MRRPHFFSSVSFPSHACSVSLCAGMFRPEMLRPMGLPEDVRVIAWGLGLERQTMLVYGIKHIRDLVGPKVKLDIIQKNPICRFDKNEVA
jgi:phenylalanyl-tRNA synthetase alpha chain